MASIPPPMPVGYNAPQPPGQVPPAFANMMAQRYMRRFPQTGGPQVPAAGVGVDPNDPRMKLAAAIKARQAAGLQPQGAMPPAAGPMPTGGVMPGGGF